VLGKTANGLYWMYRYLERAENIARLIEAGQRIALTRLRATDEEWISVLQSGSVYDGYKERHDEVAKDTAIDWMLRDRDNISSVYSCIAAARQNARLVRTAITGDVWEAVNASYMSAQKVLARKVNERDLPATLRRLRADVGLVRGATLGTMLRNEIYDFARLGTFVERTDATARILDVKYYVLLPSVRAVGTSIDNVQWESILRSVSAGGGFRLEYGASGGPQEIANFLILDRRMPRSLAFSTAKICDNLGYLEDPAHPVASLAMAASLRDSVIQQTMEDIIETGLHDFLQEVMRDVSAVSLQIEKDFRFYE